MKRKPLKRKTPLKAKKPFRWNPINTNGRIPLDVRFEVLERSGGVCEECGNINVDFRGLRYHHIIFRSHGGLDTADNLLLLCGKCHSENME